MTALAPGPIVRTDVWERVDGSGTRIRVEVDVDFRGLVVIPVEVLGNLEAAAGVDPVPPVDVDKMTAFARVDALRVAGLLTLSGWEQVEVRAGRDR